MRRSSACGCWLKKREGGRPLRESERAGHSVPVPRTNPARDPHRRDGQVVTVPTRPRPPGCSRSRSKVYCKRPRKQSALRRPRSAPGATRNICIFNRGLNVTVVLALEPNWRFESKPGSTTRCDLGFWRPSFAPMKQ